MSKKQNVRNAFLFLIFTAFSAVAFSEGIPTTPSPTPENGVVWYDAATWNCEGRGWNDTSTPFTRLPERAKEQVTTAVWNLSQHSAGLIVRFKTNASKIQVRHQVAGNLAMPHMTTVGSSGLDLYAKDKNGRWRWAGISKPTAQKYEDTILQGVSQEMREYALYQPLYNTTTALSVGVPEGSVFEAVAPSANKPIFYYGTSIAHGCSASRPGMTVPAILGRRLDKPVINFGFSGSAKMEHNLAKIIREVDASAFIFDSLPNMSPQEVKERAETFIREICKTHPDTPIILVEDRTFTNAWLKPNVQKTHLERRLFFRQTYEKLTAEGMKNLIYVEGQHLLGDDDEGTVDSSHPTDLGMIRMADILEPVLRKTLEK
ncbi:MAG: SGNH/GDSL hydrolase family protein [Planctomycetaceae bacterium]|jgi:lysophospholipase L1-like esterase|nr:SGNH/GDSL hydrolase family protein [Planctomycetaceae bacterium]